jgi:hypothetical protein
MVALTPYPRGITMETTRPLPTPDRAAALDCAFRLAMPIDEGPDFAFPAIYSALATAFMNDAPMAEVIHHELRHRIAKCAPHQAEALRLALTAVDHPTAQGADWSYALAYAAYRVVDDALVAPKHSPTAAELMTLARYLGGLTRLLGLSGVKVKFYREVGPKP